MNLLDRDEHSWLEDLREYYCAQLIGHMLADPTKARKIPERLPMTLQQIECVRVINAAVDKQDSHKLHECMAVWPNFWPDDGAPQELHPWDKVVEHVPLLVAIVAAYDAIRCIDEPARLLRVVEVKALLKQALGSIDGHLIEGQ